jgi:hypothetical protein
MTDIPEQQPASEQPGNPITKELVEILEKLNLEIGPRKAKKPRGERKDAADLLDKHLNFLAKTLSAIGAEYQTTDNTFNWNNSKYGPNSMADRVFSAKPAKDGWSRTAAQCAMEVYINQKRQVLREQLKQQVLVYDASIGDTECRKFVGLMTDVADESVDELHLLALQSFIWQIKRKIAGQYVLPDPIMPIFTGGQGYGKSWTLARLFAPIKTWVAAPTTLDSLNDRFNTDTFYNNFVVPLEDIDKSEKRPNMTLLKTLVTEECFSFRPPGERGVLKLPTSACLYATSNYSVTHLLPDDTGARRWWEIKAPDRDWTDADTARLNLIDFGKLWRSIDGKSPVNPRSCRKADYVTIQREVLRHRTLVEQYFDECVEVTDNPEHSIPEEDLYQACLTWCSAQARGSYLRKDVRNWALRKAPLKRDGGLSTSTDNKYTFRGVRFR